MNWIFNAIRIFPMVAVTRSKRTVTTEVKTVVTKVRKVSNPRKSQTKAAPVKANATPTPVKPTTDIPVVKLKVETEIKTTVKSSSGEFIPEFKKALENVRSVDPWLEHLFDKESLFLKLFGANPDRDTKTPDEQLQMHYESLLRGILAQQISGAAANSINRKFKLLYRTPSGDMAVPEKALDYTELIPPKDQVEEIAKLDKSLSFPTPQLVAKTSIELLRTAGLSARKAEYAIGLSQAFVDEKLALDLFINGTDDEIVDALVSLKGIGPWSADMFLLFGLRRLNVFSFGDLGIQRGVSVYLDQSPYIKAQLESVDWSEHVTEKEPGNSARSARTVAKKVSAKNGKKSKWKVPDKTTMEWIANKYSPYRSVLMLVLWHLSAMDLSALEKTEQDKPDSIKTE